MIDLRAPNAQIAEYVRRYADLLPAPSPSIQRRMWDSRVPMPEELKNAPEPDVAPWLVPQGLPDLLDEGKRKKAVGMLVGLAVGDAVGTTLEFRQRDSAQVTDMVGGGPFGLAPGEWTDDTSMALCLADTILAKGGADPRDFATRLFNWYQFGENSHNGRCFDIGITTRDALERFRATGHSQSGSADPSAAGNGSIIRLAPIVIHLRRSLHRAWVLSQSQSRATHNAPEALSACQYLGVLLWLALNGVDKEMVLAPRPLALQPRVMLINAGEYKEKRRDQIRSSGYVIDTLEAALWAVWNTDNFRDAVLLAVNLADDADSVGAVVGQLAGTLYGIDGIPPEWREKLAWSDRIERIAGELFDRAEA